MRIEDSGHMDIEELIATAGGRPLVPREAAAIHPAANVDKTQEIPASFEHEPEAGPVAEENLVFEHLGPNVEMLDITTSHDIPPARCLQAAHNAKLVEVVIMGVDDKGVPFLSRSTADMATSVFHVHRAMHMLMRQMDEIESTPVADGPQRA